MRSSTLLSAMGLVLGVACSSGGQTDPASASGASSSSGAGGASSASASSSSGSGQTTSSSSSSATSASSSGMLGAGGAGSECAMLTKSVLSALGQAQKCVLGMSPGECTDLAGGICCPVLVADKNSAEANAYEKVLLAYEAAGCSFPCPPGSCDLMPVGECAPLGPNASGYHCTAK